MRYIFLLFFLIHSLFANQTLVDDLSKLSANSLYNLDEEQLKASIEPYLKRTKDIQAITIIDATDKSIFLQALKQNDKIIFKSKLPQKILSYKKYSSQIIYDNEVIGEVIIYCNLVNGITLSKEEKKWVDTHTVTIGVEQWSPVVFSNNGNDIDGICGDFTKKIIKRTGLKIKIINDNWDKLLKSFQNKQIDLLPATYFTKKRATYGLYSDGYFKMRDSIYFKESTNDITSLKDLEGKTLAIPKGYGTIDKLQEQFPKIKLVFTKDLDDSINRVLNGRVTAFYEGQIAAAAKIEDELIRGLKSVSVKAFKAPSLHYFTQIDEPILNSIIQKGLSSISYQEKTKIISKWINSNQKVILTEDETKWLNQNIEIRYAFDPHWKPLEWSDSVQEHQGIISDVLKLIEQKSGIKIKPIYSTSWDDVLKKVKNKKADMFLSGEILDNKHLNFTKNNILTSPYVFVTRVDDDYLNGFDSIENKKVGVFKNSSIHNILRRNKLDKNLILFTSDEKALMMLKNKELDVAILSANMAKYYINILQYNSTLKIAYKTQYNLQLKFALNKSIGTIPLSIIDKSLKVISEKELSDIVDKWTKINIQTKTDWTLLAQIGGGVILIILFILWNNHKLHVTVKEKTKDLEDVLDSMETTIKKRTQELNDEKNFINTIINSQENFVITSDGVYLKTANKAFFNFYNVETVEQFMEKYGNCICDTFNKEAPLEYIHKITNNERWINYISNRPNQIHKVMINRNNENYIFTVTSEKLFIQGQELKTAIFTDITAMEKARKEVEQILANILLPVLITSKKNRKILYANKYAEQQYEKTLDEIIGSDIDDVYTVKGQQQHIIDAIKKYGFLENSEEEFKTSTGKSFTALLSVTPIVYSDEECYIGMITDITKQKEMENEVRQIHKHTRDSIEYASLIQGALIPRPNSLAPFFKDYFVTWTPKDTVGGDIWLFNKLRHDDECLLFFIDCTGHGVPGAFVTMIVKSIEREIVSSIQKHPEFDISPAIIMGYFNATMKKLLRQENQDSLSNAGWDGGIIYYNRRTQILKFAGAETPLFYMTKEGEFNTVKGNRYSVGYKKCDMNYQYKETIIQVEDGMKFYCTTDGYLDQNGGEKDFPFGKKRFGNIIKKYYTESMADIQTVLQMEMMKWENQVPNNERNDDMTVIGFEIGKKSDFNESKQEEIVKYEGVMTQNVIATAMDNIEAKIDNIGMIGVISTITIEYCQNMMNYSKGIRETDGDNIVPAGRIEVRYIDNSYYKIIATNILSKQDKQKVEPKLIEVQSLDKQSIKKRYRELRKSGANTHEKGGGIGMYEIAKVSDKIEYNFTAINDDKYYFTMISIVNEKKKRI